MTTNDEGNIQVDVTSSQDGERVYQMVLGDRHSRRNPIDDTTGAERNVSRLTEQCLIVKLFLGV